MLIEDMGEHLSHKPFEWQSWWWGIQWKTFIDISPQLTEENPLWQREDSYLENIRLCGLPPRALQAEVAAYWEKSFWQRWFLSFFTDIDNKIVIWSYYKRCLSFRIIYKANPALEQRLMVYDPEQRLVNQLMHKLKQDNGELENRLERYSGNAHWVEKNLSVLLAQHEKRRQRFFLKLLNKHLKAFPEEYERASVRKKLEEEYQALEKILRNYVENSCAATMGLPASIPRIEENPNRDVVYVGPAVVTEKKASACVDRNCSLEATHEWLALKRQEIEELLKEEFFSNDVIQSLLKASLQRVESCIEQQLADYENVIDEVGYRRFNYKTALECSERLQNRLAYFFRQSSLLFHPDKSNGNEDLERIKTELFKEFQQITENSFERLNKGCRLLGRYVSKSRVEFDKKIEEMKRDQKAFSQRMQAQQAKIKAQQVKIKAQQAKIKAQQAKIRTQQAKIRAQQAEIRVQLNEMGAKQKQTEEQLKALIKQVQTPASYPEEVDAACATQGFFRPHELIENPAKDQEEPERSCEWIF